MSPLYHPGTSVSQFVCGMRLEGRSTPRRRDLTKLEEVSKLARREWNSAPRFRLDLLSHGCCPWRSRLPRPPATIEVSVRHVLPYVPPVFGGT